MLAAVEFVADKDDRVFFDASQKIGPQVAAALAASGVIGRAMPQGDILGFAPPLCLTREEAGHRRRKDCCGGEERVCQSDVSTIGKALIAYAGAPFPRSFTGPKDGREGGAKLGI